MARRTIDKDFVDRLTEGFAAHPGNASAAATFAHCDHRTARRGWAIGWPKQGFRPIMEVIAERQQAARALAVQRQADAREADYAAAQAIAEKARLDAARSTEEEGRIARGARNNAVAALMISQNLLKAGLKISQDLTEQELKSLKPSERIKALKVIAEFNREAVSAAEASIKLERLIMGEPTERVEHKHEHTVTVATPTEMVDMIDRANRALDRARQRGIIDATAVPALPSGN